MKHEICLHGLEKEKILSPNEMKSISGKRSEGCSGHNVFCWGSCVTEAYGDSGVCVAEEKPWDPEFICVCRAM